MIAEIGYPQLSIRKIAERVGVAMSVVLYHFGNKDNLVDAIIERMYRSALAAVAPAVEAESTSANKLRAYISANLAHFNANRMQLAALAQLSASYKPAERQRFDELGLNTEIREQLEAIDPEAILQAGQRAGEFRDFPATSTAIALRGAVNAAVEKILRDPGFDVGGYGEDLIEMFARVVGVAP